MTTAPIFVKIEDYKGVLDIVDHVKDKVADAITIVERLKEIRKQEDAELEQWEMSLNDISKRIDSIDREFIEPEGA